MIVPVSVSLRKHSRQTFFIMHSNNDCNDTFCLCSDIHPDEPNLGDLFLSMTDLDPGYLDNRL